MGTTPTVRHLAAALRVDKDLEPIENCCRHDKQSLRQKWGWVTAMRHVETAKHQLRRHGVDVAVYRAAKAHPLADTLRTRLMGSGPQYQRTSLDVWLGDERWERFADRPVTDLAPLVELFEAGLTLDEAERALGLLAV